jgi:hypothetical protein
MGIKTKPTVTLFPMKGCALLIGLFLVSCGVNVTVKPEVSFSNNHNPVIVRGDIVYEGNPIYLPATVEQKKGANVTIKYAYVISYDGTGKAEIIAAFLPTTLLGMPTGADDVMAIGKLEIFKDNSLLKTYVGEVMVSKPRSLFLGGVDKTELRRLALTSLKENIELQMRSDFLSLSGI